MEKTLNVKETRENEAIQAMIDKGFLQVANDLSGTCSICQGGCEGPGGRNPEDV